jgi:hypothetical protein
MTLNTRSPGSNTAPLWLFLHIPKTAGSSFRASLAAALQPEHNINIDRWRGKILRDPAFRSAIDEFIALDKIKAFRFASGHLKMAEILDIKAAVNRQVNIITMLRNPAERVISEFRYQRTPAHPQYAQFRETFPSLKAFVHDRRSQNKMFRHLSLANESVEQTIERMQVEFSFVGMVEMYALSAQLCSKAVGVAIEAGRRIRITEKSEEDRDMLSDVSISDITELNGLDDKIWRHFRDRLGKAELEMTSTA